MTLCLRQRPLGSHRQRWQESESRRLQLRFRLNHVDVRRPQIGVPLQSRLNQVWDTANTLDEQIYLAVLLTGTLNGLCSLAAALIQQYNIYAVVCIAVGAIVFCLLTALILQRHSAPYRQRLALVCVLNFFYFPVAFFIFGGLNSGIELFYLLGLFFFES